VAGNKPSALDRARADLTVGRPDLARDRVHGYLVTLNQRGEYSQETYSLMGEIYFAMRDYPRAGAMWMLTERDDADAQKAFDAFAKRYPKNSGREAVNPRAPSELYPPKVQERLKQWNYRYVPRRIRKQGINANDEGEVTGVRPIEAGCLVAGVILLVMACFYIYLTFFGRRH